MAGGKWRGSTRKARLPRDWDSEVRPRILKRDGYICYVCGQPGADGVDHITAGDDHSDTNLKAIHHNVPPYCHRSKSSSEGGRAAQAKRIPRKRPTERHPGLL